MNQDTPVITNACYTSSTSDFQSLIEGPAVQAWANQIQCLRQNTPIEHQEDIRKKPQMQNRRIVQVFIADPNENVPLDKSVLYTGTQKLTDLTDTELFFEVPITSILETHNKTRITYVDKESSKRAGKDILLDPIRIRELKMVVVTIAQF